VKPPSIAALPAIGRGHAVREDATTSAASEAEAGGDVRLEVEEAEADEHHDHRQRASRVETTMFRTGRSLCCQIMRFSWLHRRRGARVRPRNDACSDGCPARRG
jgi:hypothetical protein